MRSLRFVVLFLAACSPVMSPVDAGSLGGGTALIGGGSSSAGGSAGGASAGGTATAGGTASAGGSAAGGSATVDAGTDGGSCPVLDFPVTASVLQEAYISNVANPYHYVAYGVPSVVPDAGTLRDAMTVELYTLFNWANPVLPVQTLLGPTTFRDCTACVRYLVGCSQPRSCQRYFLAQAGSLVLTRADRDSRNGALTAATRDLELLEWDLNTDLPLTNGACFTLPRWNFTGTWGDAGVVTAAAFLDAGVDPCAATQQNSATTVGCNGGFTTSLATPNLIHGSCAVDGGPGNGTNGSCESQLTCLAPVRATMGRCLQFCGATSTYVSTGGCPQGHRCVPQDKFNVPPGLYGVCARDCDSTHPCPNGERCDAEGSCGF